MCLVSLSLRKLHQYHAPKHCSRCMQCLDLLLWRWLLCRISQVLWVGERPAPIYIAPGPAAPQPALVARVVVTAVVDMFMMGLFVVHDVVRVLALFPIPEESHHVNQCINSYQDYHLEF